MGLQFPSPPTDLTGIPWSVVDTRVRVTRFVSYCNLKFRLLTTIWVPKCMLCIIITALCEQFFQQSICVFSVSLYVTIFGPVVTSPAHRTPPCKFFYAWTEWNDFIYTFITTKFITFHTIHEIIFSDFFKTNRTVHIRYSWCVWYSWCVFYGKAHG